MHGIVSEYRLSLATSYVLMGATMLAHIILVPRYLAALGSDGFGVLVMILGLITYVAAAVGGWLNAGLQRILGVAFASKDCDGFAQSVDAAKVVFVGYSVAAALAGAIVGISQGQIATSVIIAAGLFFVASQEFSVERLALTATGRLATSNSLQVIQLVLYVSTVIVALDLGWGLTGVFVCNLASVLVVRVLVLINVHVQRPRRRLPTYAALQGLLKKLIGRMGGGYIIANVIAISSQSDVLVVGALGGAEAATRFVLIWKIAEFFVQIMWRIPEMATPILIRLDTLGSWLEIRQRYLNLISLTAALAIPGGFVYALAGPWMLRVWLGPDQAPENQLGFWLAGVGIISLALTRPPVVFAEALARLRLANIVAFCTLAVRLGLTVVLYPRFGYIAPLVALTVVYASGAFAAYLWVGWKLVQVPQWSDR
jgi:O-antigen/teichoic acid export membrane protein